MFRADYRPPTLTGFNGENLSGLTKKALLPLAPLLMSGVRLAGGYLLRRALPAVARWGVTRAAPAIARFMRGGVRTIGKGIGVARSQQVLKPVISSVPSLRPGLTGTRAIQARYAASRSIPQVTSDVKPGVGTRFVDWATGRKTVDPATGKTPGGWGQAANVGGKLLNTAFYGSMLPDLTDTIGGVFGRKAKEEIGEMSAPALNNFPQFRYAMGKYGSAERRAAFEYGVDRFCKEAGFDSEDRVALYNLFNKQAFLPNPFGEETAATNAVSPAPARPSFLPSPFGETPVTSSPVPSRNSNWNPNKGGQNLPSLGERMYGSSFRQPGKSVSPVTNEPQKKEAPWWDVTSWPGKLWRAATPNLVSRDYDPGTEASEKARMQRGTAAAKSLRRKESFNEQVRSLTEELNEDPVTREQIAAQGEMGIRFWARTHRIPVYTAREAIRQSAVELRDLDGDTRLSEGLARMGYTDLNKPLPDKLTRPQSNFSLLQRPEGQLVSATGSIGQANSSDSQVPGGGGVVPTSASVPASPVPANPNMPVLTNPAAKVKSAAEKLIKMSFGSMQPAIVPTLPKSQVKPELISSSDLQKSFRPNMTNLSNLSQGQGAVWPSNSALSEVSGTGPVSNQPREEWGNRRVGRPMTAEDRKAFASSQGSLGIKPPDFSTWLKSNYSPSQRADIPGTDK